MGGFFIARITTINANRLQVAVVRETTPGTTPANPRMRAMRVTGESLSFAPQYVDSDEIRPDRMLGDPIETMQAAAGGINFELSYPDDNSPLSDIYRSAFENVWINTPTFYNDGTADSIITDAGTTPDTYAVTAGGAAVVASHLVRATGFAQSANNLVFKAGAGSGTTIVGTGLGLVAEIAPPGTAKLKVVGFQGANGDIASVADGITSTVLDFTTLGIPANGWLKINATADASTFAFLVAAGLVARSNAWARVVSVTAHKITLDNLPASWAIDAGTGKTIKVWFGDEIKNGTTQTSLTIERGFLGQTVPTYIVNTGMQVNTLTHTITSKDKIKGSVAFVGMGGGESQVALDASPDPVTTGLVMAANKNVGRLGVNGSQLTAPNWSQEITFVIDNNLRTQESIDSTSPVGVVDGSCKVTGKMKTYFGNDTELAAFYNGTPRSINARVSKNSQAIIIQVPRATYRGDGSPNATGKDTDVMVSFDYQASYDAATSAHVIMDRVEYFE